MSNKFESLTDIHTSLKGSHFKMSQFKKPMVFSCEIHEIWNTYYYILLFQSLMNHNKTTHSL